MAVRLREAAARVGRHEAADLVHLQADAVADAMREESAADAGFHRDFPATR